MAQTDNSAPNELESRKSRREYFYPAARVDFQIVFENYDALNPDTPQAFGVLPKSLTIHRNSYKEADTFQVTFDASAFPVTPDAIRAGAIEIRLFQTEGSFEQATDLATLSVYGVDPSIVGLFDQTDIEYSESGREVTISGTDYTSLFVAKPWPKNRRVDGGKRLDVAIQKLMEEVGGVKTPAPTKEYDPYNSGNAINLVVEPLDLLSSMPTLGKADSKTNKNKITVQGDNYWDVMYNLATRYGFILFVRNLDVVLTTPKSYETQDSRTRAMAWGENVLSLKMSRKMGRERTPIILVKSYDDVKRKTISGQFPKTIAEQALTDPELANSLAQAKAQQKKNADSVQIAPSGNGGVNVEFKVFTISGIKEEAILNRAAESLYFLLSRGEMQVSITTRDLKDLDGEDLLDLSAGDAVTLSFKPLTLDILEAQDYAERVSTLTNLGYPSKVATSIADAIEKTNIFKHPLRVKEVILDWGIEGGLTISLQLQNFVNIDLVDKVA